MFIGHYGAALASSRAAPRVSLGILIAACQLPDLIWPIFLLTGVERARIVQGENSFLNLVFEHYPWTHSLAMVLVWAVIAAILYRLWRRDDRGAVVVGALVLSHWVLDWIVHVPDLPLYPGSATYGLGVWRSAPLTLAIEIPLFALGLWLYASHTRGRDAIGRVGFWALVGVLAVTYGASMASPPPPSVNALGWGALAAWLVPLWGAWVDTHRDRVVLHARALP
jgi:membrane-bound metal-dependent hydrolase YbcI (DUF457 family)